MRTLGLKPGSVLSGCISDICHECGIEQESSSAVCYMAAQMLKFYHLWVTLWSPGKFHTYECWHHNATGTPQYRKPYMKISVFGGPLILGEGVVDHRERWRNKGVGEDGWKAFVFSMEWMFLPWLISGSQCEVIDLSSEKTYAQSKPGEGDGCTWLIKARFGGLWVLKF